MINLFLVWDVGKYGIEEKEQKKGKRIGLRR